MSITSRINEMSSHIEQAYDELQGLGADLTNVNKNIENISMVLDDIYDSLPSVSGEGTSLTLDDTRVGKIKSTLKGNTSQTTYSGKNLLDSVKTSQTQTGVTVTPQSDGSFKITGTTTSGLGISLVNSSNYPVLEAGTYTRSVKCVGTITKNGKYVFLTGRNSNNTDVMGDMNIDENTTTSKTTTLSQTETMSGLNLWVSGSGVVFNCVIYVQLESGSSATEWEPYTGKTPSPNPSYPQPVNVVSGDNEIEVCGKNLFDSSTFSLKTYGGANNSARCSQSQAVSLKAGKYVFTTNLDLSVYDYKCDVLAEPPQTVSTETYIINNGFITNVNTWTLNLTQAQEGYLGILIRKKDNTSLDLETIKGFQFQLEKTSATTYEPYQGNTYNIDLPVENLLPPPSNSSSSTGVGNMTLTWNTSNDFHLSGSATSTGNVWGGTVASDYTIKEGDYLHLCNDSVPSGTIQFVGLTPTTTQAFAATINSKNKVLDLTSYVGKTIHSVFFYCVSGASADMTMTPMIVNGMPKVLSFTPYGTTPIELCKIGNYQDYFYKDSGKWYLHKEIGKVVLNGSETWYKSTSYPGNYYCQNGVPNAILHDINCFSNLTNVFWYSVEQLASGDNGIMLEGGSSNRTIDFKISSISTLADFKTFLGNNNLILYYTLDTPTNTEITYQPLIDQLNELEKAMSKDGQTNISQINNDLPFIISASALKEWQESTSLNSTLSMVNPLSLGNTLNTQENNTQPIEVDNIEPLEEEENEES